MRALESLLPWCTWALIPYCACHGSKTAVAFFSTLPFSATTLTTITMMMGQIDNANTPLTVLQRMITTKMKNVPTQQQGNAMMGVPFITHGRSSYKALLHSVRRAVHSMAGTTRAIRGSIGCVGSARLACVVSQPMAQPFSLNGTTMSTVFELTAATLIPLRTFAATRRLSVVRAVFHRVGSEETANTW